MVEMEYDLGVMEDDLEMMEEDQGMMDDDLWMMEDVIAMMEDDLENLSCKCSSPMNEEWIKTIYMTEINRSVS